MRQQNLKFPRVQWHKVGGMLTGAILAIALYPNARAAALTDWKFDPSSHQLELNLGAGSVPTYYIETDPPRIVIDLPDTPLNTADRDRSYPGAVRHILLSPLPAGGTRIVLELTPEIALSPQQVQLQKIASENASDRWILYPSIISLPASVPASPPAVPPLTIPKIEFGQPWPESPKPPQS
ncbi:AMIN domain-containing protein [Oscillatoria sp. FACHB-1406]|uniref:AMIN domain-containing protein n=1 Tax=Oscillatoria sp. FACHB-1406 TaxID=2692846 RepID=UPI0016887F1E|nr:AMIN domain-containing protein [Oscillatoria sp. FACHB-1406]MBD2578782.1 AMIN domain-containing protein [Oscillatoria sp. FACHB-1406]